MRKIMITYEIETKLPEWATPAALKALHDGGKSLRAIAEMAGVSHETIRQQILHSVLHTVKDSVSKGRSRVNA